MRKKIAVIVVDDDHAVRESLKFDLELEGLSVQALAGAAELLACPDLDKADCLVLDCKMPAMDGFAVLDALAGRITVPVILITAPVTETLRRRAERAGVFRVLEKPLLDKTLLKNIREAIRP
jgi:two-component system response regulator FixJ